MPVLAFIGTGRTIFIKVHIPVSSTGSHFAVIEGQQIAGCQPRDHKATAAQVAGVRINNSQCQLRGNGRIDRTLQPSPEVWCHYFVYPDRSEDAVLEALVHKVETIQRELGTLGDVVMQRMERALSLGIQAETAADLERAQIFSSREHMARQELESQRATTDKLRRETDEAGRIRESSAKLMRFNERLLRDAVDVGLELATAGGKALEPLDAAARAQHGLDVKQGCLVHR